MSKFSCSKDPKIVTNNEEFTFPVMSNPLASFMLSASSSSSSSLWRISSRVYHHQDEEEDYRMEVRSMCEGFSPTNKREIECGSCQGDELEVEERMDYLWEDFNEEEKNDHMRLRDVKTGEICSLKGWPKTSRRSSSVLMVGKLLKGLLSIRKSAQQKIMKSRF